jgi:hypothetical protein
MGDVCEVHSRRSPVQGVVRRGRVLRDHGVARWDRVCVAHLRAGFQPLRWRFTRNHDDSATANLSDRTDGGQTKVDFFAVEAPLTAISRAPVAPIALPPRGGLVRAVSKDAEAVAIAPTNPACHFPLRQPSADEAGSLTELPS